MLSVLLKEMTEQECHEFLGLSRFGRLGCSLDDEPYVVPFYFACDSGFVYALATRGQKIEWMRKNPKVCVQIDEIKSATQWVSVIGRGLYEELADPQYADERVHARKLLGRRPQWWLGALGERQLKSGNGLIEPLFFRIRITSVTGLRATRETDQSGP
ncbi:MAG: hypothetical protein C5B55_10740 [Blastocatellia bacterium]|nr:MAG: hypothetical protein C5B55_10740 [Blastocatellia bacterium]